MKILFYTNSIYTFGGVQRVLAVVAKELSRQHDVTILTLDRHEDEDRSMYGLDESSVDIVFMDYPETSLLEHCACKAVSALYKKALPHTALTSGWYARSSFAPSYRKKLAGHINRHRYDIVVGVHVFLALHIAAISSCIKAKTIGWLHNSFEAMFDKEDPYVPAALQDHCSHQLKRLDKVVVLSDSDHRLFRDRMQLQTQRIYNPLTIEVKGQASHHAKRFLSIGRMENGHKGFDILIKAFAKFAKADSEWHLDIVGDGPKRGELQALIDSLGIADRVHMHPFTNHVEDHYTATSVYVLASRWEGFGLVLVEAMAYGHSIIASDLPVTRELLAGCPFACTFPVGDTDALAAQMLQKAHEDDLQTMGEAARTHARDFSLNAIRHEWEDSFNCPQQP